MSVFKVYLEAVTVDKDRSGAIVHDHLTFSSIPGEGVGITLHIDGQNLGSITGPGGEFVLELTRIEPKKES